MLRETTGAGLYYSSLEIIHELRTWKIASDACKMFNSNLITIITNLPLISFLSRTLGVRPSI